MLGVSITSHVDKGKAMIDCLNRVELDSCGVRFSAGRMKPSANWLHAGKRLPESIMI